MKTAFVVSSILALIFVIVLIYVRAGKPTLKSLEDTVARDAADEETKLRAKIAAELAPRGSGKKQ